VNLGALTVTMLSCVQGYRGVPGFDSNADVLHKNFCQFCWPMLSCFHTHLAEPKVLRNDCFDRFIEYSNEVNDF